jgi:hypothetical protein
MGISAQASTISYTFTEGGWTDKSGDVGTLNGTFTGSVEGNGNILTRDLTSFEADFHETVNGLPNTFIFNLPTLSDFSFNTIDDQLNFADGSGQSGVQLCTGPDTDSVCFGIPPNSGSATPFSGFFEDLPLFGPLTTTQGAVATASAAPEPQSVGLIIAAGGLLLGLGCMRRRATISTQR